MKKSSRLLLGVLTDGEGYNEMTKKSMPITSLSIACLILSMAASADAKIFFLDNHQGIVNGSTTYDPTTRSAMGGSSLVYTSSWDAGNALDHGDTLYIREGEYWEDVTGKSGYRWYSHASLSIGSSNCLIQNYNNEIVWIKGGASRNTPQFHPNNAITYGGSNNVISGIHVYGSIIFSGTSNTLKDSDLSGGWDHQSGVWMDKDAAWPNCIRFVNSKNALVRNCRVHDNFLQSGNASNMAIIMHERDDNTIIENCEFYNTAKAFGYLKYQNGSRNHAFTGSGTHATYRFNVFKGPQGGFEGAASFPGPAVQKSAQLQIFHQNVFINCNGAFGLRGAIGRHMWVYNNTFYNLNGGMSNWLGGQIYNWFNNIVYWDKTTSAHYNINFESKLPDPFTENHIDYNQYYSPNGKMGKWKHGNFNTTTLSSWVAHSGNRVETHSFVSNPGFKNASGLFNTPTDFKRSSYPADGRGGGYPSVIGAYVTGNELIGINPAGLPSQ